MASLTVLGGVEQTLALREMLTLKMLCPTIGKIAYLLRLLQGSFHQYKGLFICFAHLYILSVTTHVVLMIEQLDALRGRKSTDELATFVVKETGRFLLSAKCHKQSWQVQGWSRA